MIIHVLKLSSMHLPFLNQSEQVEVNLRIFKCSQTSKHNLDKRQNNGNLPKSARILNNFDSEYL